MGDLLHSQKHAKICSTVVEPTSTFGLSKLVQLKTSIALQSSARPGPALTDSCRNSTERAPQCYEEKIFEDHSLEIIKNHDATETWAGNIWEKSWDALLAELEETGRKGK